MSICMWVLLSCSRKAKERALRQASGWDQAPANYYPDDDEILRIFSGILPKVMCKQWLQGVLLTSHWVYSSSWWTSLLTRCHAKAVTPTCRQDAHRQLFHQWKFMHLAHTPTFPLHKGLFRCRGVSKFEGRAQHQGYLWWESLELCTLVYHTHESLVVCWSILSAFGWI